MNATPVSQTLLSRALLADGVISGATGALMFAAASPLSQVLGLQSTLLRTAGISLLPFAALLVYLALRPRVPRPLVWGIVGYNLLWAIDSLLLLTTGWVAPTLWGYLFTGVQALAVAVFAGLQYAGLRHSSAALA
ncbi:hypothetical protein JRI60_50175 [Archangium violaceum]|uniref:hypothetical protein n=1 Tax=Archangium violaceum TaxID=83451 RepID=UPI00194DFB29|nr:hypothetical protein [Archangium violaceum]QRN97042.1 hypothetical protein JRI60_50175 [Archangium violaceum]